MLLTRSTLPKLMPPASRRILSATTNTSTRADLEGTASPPRREGGRRCRQPRQLPVGEAAAEAQQLAEALHAHLEQLPAADRHHAGLPLLMWRGHKGDREAAADQEDRQEHRRRQRLGRDQSRRL